MKINSVLISIYLIFYIFIELYFSFNYFGSDLSIQNFFGAKKYNFFLLFLFSLIFRFLKILIVSSLIYLGLWFNLKNIKFDIVFYVCFFAESIFLLSDGLFILDNSLFRIENFSLFYFLPIEGILKFLLITFSLYEILYWIILSFLLAKYLNRSLDSMLKVVLGYYVPFLFCWVVFVMFISLGNS
ncbi:hypothetical protein SAMN03080598_01988 [Algoriphagus boritolerans DSM 17298 = JCM 18970]|uniref:Yip1 domain-containing protein n=1 Tax=Algoriphagus boritolerans DSM 17298 = JCM 18970 TaxID=1120964 RepID=A0A1H5W9B5_9BACT|nr:hypothetical protein SAMN03080598_01988 [Algoriphagus boritolerans DSM 17298 = JCM 18970]